MRRRGRRVLEERCEFFAALLRWQRCPVLWRKNPATRHLPPRSRFHPAAGFAPLVSRYGGFHGVAGFAVLPLGVVARGSPTRLRRTFAAAPPWAFAHSRFCSLSPSRLRLQNHTVGSTSGSPSLRWVVVCAERLRCCAAAGLFQVFVNTPFCHGWWFVRMAGGRSLRRMGTVCR